MLLDMVETPAKTEENAPSDAGAPPPSTNSWRRRSRRRTASARLPTHLAGLADKARDYVKAASSANTNRAYEADWRHFNAWRRRQGLSNFPANEPRIVGLYITACASGAASADRKPNSVATIERRLSALSWGFRQLGESFDRKDKHVITVLAGIKRTHARPPVQKEAVLPEDLLAMLATLEVGDLRGLRDRAILLHRLRRRVAPLGNRRARLRGQANRRRFRLDRDSRQGPGRDLARQNRLARGRDRARLERGHLPYRRAADLAQVRAHRAMDRCFAASPAPTKASGPTG